MRCPVDPRHEASKVYETEEYIFIRCNRKHGHIEAPVYDRFTRTEEKRETVFMISKEN